VAAAITNALAAFQVPARVAALADLHDRRDGNGQIANALVEAFGVTLVPGMLALLDDPAWQSKAPAVISLMCDYAPLLAPALADHVAVTASAARAVVKVLGFAGDGYETAIEEQLEHDDEQTSREALRALARIGSTQAAALVAGHLQASGVQRRAAAEEALWRFPAVHARAQVRQLLGRRDFVVGHPDLASRLLTRAANSGAGTDGLQDVLAGIESLRFRFWNPGLVRVAMKARELRAR
jgi:HEAT repeat protein